MAPTSADYRGVMPSANWYTDPSGRHEFRYWDGTRWTEHVASQGRQSVDVPSPPVGSRPVAATPNPGEDAKRDAEASLVPGPSLQIEHVRARKQVAAHYLASGADGRPVALIREPPIPKDSKHPRSRHRQQRGHGNRLQFFDPDGNAYLTMVRPSAESTWSPALYLDDRNGSNIGRVLRESRGTRGALRDLVEAALPVAVAPSGFFGSSMVSRIARSKIGGMKGVVAGEMLTAGAYSTMEASESSPKRGYATLRLEAHNQVVGRVCATSASNELWELQDASGRPLGHIRLSKVPSWTRLRAPSTICGVEIVSAIDPRLRDLAIAASVGLLADAIDLT